MSRPPGRGGARAGSCRARRRSRRRPPACSIASSSSEAIASSGPSSIVCRLVISVSRPKTVMNHGIPAAGSLLRPSAVRIRSAASRRPTGGTPGAGHRARRGAAGCSAATSRATAARCRAPLRSDARPRPGSPRLRTATGRRRPAAASLARPELELKQNARALDPAGLGEEHLRLRAAVRRLLEHELVRGRVEARRRRPAAAAAPSRDRRARSRAP